MDTFYAVITDHINTYKKTPTFQRSLIFGETLDQDINTYKIFKLKIFYESG